LEGKSVKKSISPREWGKALKVFRVRCSENNPLALPPLQTFRQLHVTPRTTKTVIMAKTIFVNQCYKYETGLGQKPGTINYLFEM